MEKRSVRSNGFVVGFGSPRNAFHKSRWRGECERRGDWKQDAGNPAACKAETTTTTTTTSNRTSTGGEGRNCQAHLDSNNLSFRRNQPSPGILFRRRRFVFVFRLLIGDRVFRPTHSSFFIFVRHWPAVFAWWWWCASISRDEIILRIFSLREEELCR